MCKLFCKGKSLRRSVSGLHSDVFGRRVNWKTRCRFGWSTFVHEVRPESDLTWMHLVNEAHIERKWNRRNEPWVRQLGCLLDKLADRLTARIFFLLMEIRWFPSSTLYSGWPALESIPASSGAEETETKYKKDCYDLAKKFSSAHFQKESPVKIQRRNLLLEQTILIKKKGGNFIPANK